MKLIAIDPILFSGKKYSPGEELDVPEADGKALLAIAAAKVPDVAKRKRQAQAAHGGQGQGEGEGEAAPATGSAAETPSAAATTTTQPAP